MNYTICLDPYSINFNPSQLSGNGFNIYTDADGFASPIATNIPASSIFTAPLGNCGSPLAVTLTNVPSDATQILIVDSCNNTPVISGSAGMTLIGDGIPYSTDCCFALIDVPEECLSFCNDCNIEFDVIDLNPIGRIIAGNIESSCGTVTDYVIGWYRNGDYSAPAITTGFGTAFSYQFQHPLTATTAPMVLDGAYEAIIHDIIINGNHYTSPESGSGVGTPIPFESCFGTMVVNALECNNGTFPLPYSHQISLTAAGNGVPPGPVSATYLLENTTNYFAYRFTGFTIWDELIIKFVSGNPSATTNPTLYSQPIYLEDLKVGNDAGYAENIYEPNKITNSIYPNTYNSQTFKRTLTLTGLERNLGDKLEITVKPNPSNPQTSWGLQMQCLDTFDCKTCVFEDPIPVKIKAIEIDRIPEAINGCKNQRFKNTYVSCAVTASDLWSKYTEGFISSAGGEFFTLNPWSYVATEPGTFCNINNYSNPQFDDCDVIGSGSIIFEKTNIPANGISTTGQNLGKIKFTFNNVNDYNHYKNTLITAEITLQGVSGPLTTNPADYRYYGGYIINVPIGSNACGDGTISRTYYISRHSYPNIIYTETPGSNFWSIEIPMLEVIKGLTFSGCNSCIGLNYDGNPNGIVSRFNSSSFHNINQATSNNNFSSRFINPFIPVWFTTGSAPTPPTYTIADTNYISNLFYSVETIPFISSSTSPTGWVNLPSLGGSPCANWTSSLSPGAANYGYSMYYEYKWTDFDGNESDFEVYTRVIDNSGITTPSPILIYSYIGGVGTVYQPQFFVGGAPILSIDPW